MTTYVASITGLNAAQTSDAYAALEREGRTIADPTREEVDQFLEHEAFRVRHEPNLSEKRRESIVARLRAAIGRITPNGATFHAWKNLVAEAWSRVRRKAAAAFVLGAVTFSVGACGQAPSEPAAPITAGPVAAAPTTPGPTTTPATNYDETYRVSEPKIDEAAVTKFGDDGARDGTDAALAFSQRAFYDDECLVVDGNTHVEKCVGSLGEYMTDANRADWDASVKDFVRDVENKTFGQSQGSANVLSVSFFGGMSRNDPVSVQAATEGPLFVNRKIGKVQTTVSTDGRLQVSLESEAEVRCTNDGVPSRLGLERSITYYMVKTGDGWKVDAWTGNWSPTGVKAEK